MAVRNKLVNKGEDLPIIERYEVMDKIKELDKLSEQSLIAFLYLTGCRVEEVVKYMYETHTKHNLEHRELKGEPIKKKQIEYYEEEWIVKNVRSLKRSDKMILRSIPIFINERELPLLNILKSYIETLDENAYLFNLTRQRAYQILEKVELFPHWLRHLRLTIMAIEYDYNEAELQQYTGWQGTSEAPTYVHLNIGHLINKGRKHK